MVLVGGEGTERAQLCSSPTGEGRQCSLTGLSTQRTSATATQIPDPEEIDPALDENQAQFDYTINKSKINNNPCVALYIFTPTVISDGLKEYITWDVRFFLFKITYLSGNGSLLLSTECFFCMRGFISIIIKITYPLSSAGCKACPSVNIS